MWLMVLENPCFLCQHPFLTLLPVFIFLQGTNTGVSFVPASHPAAGGSRGPALPGHILAVLLCSLAHLLKAQVSRQGHGEPSLASFLSLKIWGLKPSYPTTNSPLSGAPWNSTSWALEDTCLPSCQVWQPGLPSLESRAGYPPWGPHPSPTSFSSSCASRSSISAVARCTSSESAMVPSQPSSAGPGGFICQGPHPRPARRFCHELTGPILHLPPPPVTFTPGSLRAQGEGWDSCNP